MSTDHVSCGESAGTGPEAWWAMDRGSPEWLAEVVRSGRESMRELLDALGGERAPTLDSGSAVAGPGSGLDTHLHAGDGTQGGVKVPSQSSPPRPAPSDCAEVVIDGGDRG